MCTNVNSRPFYGGKESDDMSRMKDQYFNEMIGNSPDSRRADETLFALFPPHLVAHRLMDCDLTTSPLPGTGAGTTNNREEQDNGSN